MLGLENSFIWSDQMHVDDSGVAWFTGGEVNSLFRLDMQREVYTYVTAFPDYEVDSFRKNSVCYKYDNYIFCFPNIGEKIWVVSLLNNELCGIDINNPEGLRLGFMKVIKRGTKLYAVSIGLRQVIEIDAEKKEICEYHLLVEDDREKLCWECIEVESNIYCASLNLNKIYEFNMITKRVESFTIPMVSKGIATICHDGKNFWFSGLKKELYVWEKDKNKTLILKELPIEFGKYIVDESTDAVVDYSVEVSEEQFFLSSFVIKDEVWLVPYRSNKIIYVNSNNFKIQVFEMPEEEERAEGWSLGMWQKYILEYVRDDRFIGIYSFRNKRIYEIDVVKKQIVYPKYFLDYEGNKELWKQYINTTNCSMNENASQDFKLLLEVTLEM